MAAIVDNITGLVLNHKHKSEDVYSATLLEAINKANGAKLVRDGNFIKLYYYDTQAGLWVYTDINWQIL